MRGKAHEWVLAITSDYENANYNHCEITPHTDENG